MLAQEVYNIAMSLIDERLETGMVDPTSTAVYEKNAPYLLNILQAELAETMEDSLYIFDKDENEENESGYQRFNMPGDFYSASQVIAIETNYDDAPDFRWEQNTLLVPDEFVGEIRVLYRPIPTMITTLADNITIDPIMARTGLAYGLASRLLTNENEGLANWFNSLYDQARQNFKRRNIAMAKPIKDYYDTKLNY